MEPYRDTDIDSGGSVNLTSKDGKGVQEIVIETWGLEVPKKPIVKYDEAEEAWDAYYEEVGTKFNKITDLFGWC
jgi:hypothetical protein